MMSVKNCMTVGLLTLAIGSVARGQLNIGDPAPEISITEWVRGEPITLAKSKGEKVILLEFWATWCPPCIEAIPHMTEIQHKYKDRGLVVLGVSGPGRGESLSSVKRFVRRQADGMDYTVAYDGAGKTHSDYMGGIGAAGIPYAFLIDKSGSLMWHGHPGDPVMDEIIDQVVNGKYNVEDARRLAQLEPMIARLHRTAAISDWSAFKTTARRILEMDPKNESALEALIYGYLFQSDDVEELRRFLGDHMKNHGKNAEAMHALAMALLRIEDMQRRQPDLALQAASLAYEACKGGDCSKIDTYARAVFEIGLVDRAIELQTNAVAVAAGDDVKRSMERVLDYYKACKALQSEL